MGVARGVVFTYHTDHHGLFSLEDSPANMARGKKPKK